MYEHKQSKFEYIFIYSLLIEILLFLMYNAFIGICTAMAASIKGSH
jgi:hypothetical protein